ncbi:hypothetical protein ACFXI8_26955 [Streptomyces niveus]|uniref:hypothetical protein n=1 Tax=Streptomyces niveus TaxID=193462 RepID=UPI0036AB3361
MIAFAPDLFANDGAKITGTEKQMLDELHLRKIDLTEGGLVVAPGGYIGESTSREIAYAEERGEPVTFISRREQRRRKDPAMSFMIYHPNPNRRRARVPAKITVTHAESGRSQITLSAAARDWLRPTPGHSLQARWPANQPTTKLVILVDRDARKVKLQFAEDTETGDHVHDVKGLNGTAYITGWRLDEELGLDEGHFQVELLPEPDDGADAAARAIVDAAASTPIKRRQPAAKTDSASRP